RLRRLLHLVYTFEREFLERPELLRVVNRQIQALEIVRHAIESVVERFRSELEREDRWGPGARDDAWAGSKWAEFVGRVQIALCVDAPESYEARVSRETAAGNM